MKKLVLLLFLISFSYSFAQSYRLVWSDEFIGTSINTDNWTNEEGGHGWGNNELQFYTDRSDNSYIEDGKLVIEAKKESYGGRNYTSARLKTQGKQSFKYGRIEARIKLPYGKGIWPAFWMLGESISTVGWPKCGEIDIMEMIGGGSNDKITHGTIHWDSNGNHAYVGDQTAVSSGILADKYHLFAVEWNENEIKWFFDGNEFHRESLTQSDRSEFHDEFFIILNMAVGGDWPGSPDGSTVFPQKMYIDYVRVYQIDMGLPEININEPSNNSQFEPSSDIEIKANATDNGGSVSKVEFYQMDAKIGESTEAPFNFNWENVQEGCYEIWAKAIDNEGNVNGSDKISVKVGSNCGQAPYKGTPHKLPGIIEAENYDLGGNFTGFFDSTPTQNLGNQSGNSYRTEEGVDIEGSAESGFNIGWIVDGEWLEYTVAAETSGVYTIESALATPNNGKQFHLEIDGENVSGSVAIPNTGDWQNWQLVKVDDINIDKGIHKLRFSSESSDFNLDYIDVKLKNATSVKNNIENIREFRVNNFPNPFNGRVTFEVLANKRAEESYLKVYDIIGQEVFSKKVRINNGVNNFHWEPAKNVISGTYICNIKADKRIISKKVVYLK